MQHRTEHEPLKVLVLEGATLRILNNTCIAYTDTHSPLRSLPRCTSKLENISTAFNKRIPHTTLPELEIIDVVIEKLAIFSSSDLLSHLM